MCDETDIRNVHKVIIWDSSVQSKLYAGIWHFVYHIQLRKEYFSVVMAEKGILF